MKEVTVKLYEFGELSEDAKEMARGRFREVDARAMDEDLWGEVRGTLERYGLARWEFDCCGGFHLRSYRGLDPDDLPGAATYCDHEFLYALDGFRLPVAKRARDAVDGYWCTGPGGARPGCREHETCLDCPRRGQDPDRADELYERLYEKAMTCAAEHLWGLYEGECEYHASDEFIDEWLGDGDEMFTADGKLWND